MDATLTEPQVGRMIGRLINDYKGAGVVVDDIKQTAWLAYALARRSYDPAIGLHFASYVFRCMRKELAATYPEIRRQRLRTVSDQPVYRDGDDASDQYKVDLAAGSLGIFESSQDGLDSRDLDRVWSFVDAAGLTPQERLVVDGFAKASSCGIRTKRRQDQPWGVPTRALALRLKISHVQVQRLFATAMDKIRAVMGVRL